MFCDPDRACTFIAGGVVALAILAAAGCAHATAFRVIHNFSGGGDGCEPIASLILDSAGNLYGTTSEAACAAGSIFEIAPDGSKTVLYRFSGGSDGSGGVNGLVMDGSGDLYGTTAGGGSVGCGVIFEITASGAEKTVHQFAGGPTDGCVPRARLTPDDAGNYYGTTNVGGEHDGGTVFELTAKGHESLVYSFCRKSHCADGESPFGALIRDSSGNLYGTTQSGGQVGCHSECGTVFEVAPDGTEKVLYEFQGALDDGSNPDGTLVQDVSGNFYGTLFSDGRPGCYSDDGCGAVFELAPDGTETILHLFKGKHRDGANPIAGLSIDGTGNLFGTTVYGGTRNCTVSTGGCGVVFELAPGGTETILHSFGSGSHGANPWASLTSDGKGNLYGATTFGGQYGYGTVFEITP